MSLSREEIQEERAKRLSKLLDFYNMRPVDLVKKSDGRIQASNLSSWMTGSKTITESTVETIAEFFPEINIDWLLVRSDYMLKAQSEQIEENSVFSSRRFICPLELLQSSFDLANNQLETQIEAHSKKEIQELLDKLVSYSDFLAFEYVKKHS